MANILVIDSSSYLLEVFKFYLEDAGYRVKTASTRKSVREILRDFHTDLILLNVLLNGRDGKDVCKMIKSNRHGKNVPIILVSAGNKISNIYNECQADDILEKPFHLAEVYEKIEAHISKHLNKTKKNKALKTNANSTLHYNH